MNCNLCNDEHEPASLVLMDDGRRCCPRCRAFAQLLFFGCRHLERKQWTAATLADASFELATAGPGELWSPCHHEMDICKGCGRSLTACNLIERTQGLRCPICVHLEEGRRLQVRCAPSCALCQLAMLAPAVFADGYSLALRNGLVKVYRARIAARAMLHNPALAMHAVRIGGLG
jgi:hypothetical protein